MGTSATQKGQRIYRYVVAYDGGTAPRPYDGLCSLAICKPKIRASAQVGDWILGFRSKHPGEVLYAMQVTERIALGAYWEDPRFDVRKPGHAYPPDNIYVPDQFGGLQQVHNGVHTPGDTTRDTAGRYVLLSNRFWYFGSNSVPIPNHLAHLVHTTQGHALHVKRKADDVPRLMEWLHSWPIGLHGTPLNARHKTAEASMPSKTASNLGRNDAAKATQQRSSCSARTQPVRASRHEQSQPPTFKDRIIFSRKGFDSQYGGMPSPILPNGRLLPLPIPSSHDTFQMQHLAVQDDVDLSAVLSDLSRGRHSLQTTIHLDPDLNRRSDLRLPGWRPSLGQTGAAQGHLASQKVGPGDVFLFFGWFRQAERFQGRWRYVPKARDLHVLFGWLEIGDILGLVANRSHEIEQHPWIKNHPHVSNPSQYSDGANTLYVAREQSRFLPEVVGGGLFPSLRPQLCLTAEGHSRSIWRLPRWLYPAVDRKPLSYHGRLDRWSLGQDHCELKTVAKGQEFVLQADQYPEAEDWLRELVSLHTPA